MPRKLKTCFKFKCLELMCNTIHRSDKWADHCKKKHLYKLKNNLEVKHKIIAFKEGEGPWKPYIDKPNEKRLSCPGSSSGSYQDNSTTETGSQSQITETIAEFSNKPHQNVQAIRKSEVGEDMELEVCCTPSGTEDNMHMNLEVSPSQSHNLHQSDHENPQTEVEVCCTAFGTENNVPKPTNLQASTLHNLEISDDENIPTTVTDILSPADPASYANVKLSPEDINLALKLENQDLSIINFPTTNGRKFNSSWKKIALPNGSVIDRKWIVYSQKKDSVFCLPCLLFALPSERSIWGTTGYRGWTNHLGERDIAFHEKSKCHVSAEVARIQWISQKRIDSSLEEQADKIVHHNREVLSVIVDCCRFLSEEMMGFRNKKVVKGKLLGLFRVLSKYSPDARVYLEKIDKARANKSKLGSNFLSYRNIYDLVNVMSGMVVSKITQNINKTKVCSIILDSTQDVSKKECSTVLIRHVEPEQVDTQGTSKGGAKPVERLVKVFTAGDTTGENLAKELLSCLTLLGIDRNNIVGQSMDGAGNMRGKYSGLKTLIQKNCPKAFYTWCCSHRFALVVEKSMEMCPQMRNLFHLLEELYIFMSGHKRHHTFIKNLEKGNKNQRKQRLKRVQTTRWSSRNDALVTVVSCFDIIKQTLSELCLEKTRDSDTKASASGLLKNLSDFDTVCTMHVASAIFKVLAPISFCLQSKSIDYSVAPKIIASTQEKLSSLRNDEEWGKIKTQINVFNDEHNVALPIRRNKKRKRFMDEIAVDEAITEPFHRIKVEVYFKVLDSLQGQIDDRFPEKTLVLVSQMALFSHEGILDFKESQSNTLSTSVKKSVCIKELCDLYNLEEEKILEELNSFVAIYKVAHSSIIISDLFPEQKDRAEMNKDSDDDKETEEQQEEEIDEESTNKWTKRGFIKPYRCLLNLSGMPNLLLLYTILLSLPVTSCSAERTMSRLKIVKNGLRSSLGDEWLSSLLVLACESDMLKEFSNEDIIDKFALTTQQRKNNCTENHLCSCKNKVKHFS